MASIRKRGKSWYAEVWANNQRSAKSFPTKKLAEDWAHLTERRAQKSSLIDRTFGDLLDRYRKEVTPGKDGAAWEETRVNFFERSTLAALKVSELTPATVAAYRDQRMKPKDKGGDGVSGSTVNRDFNLLSNVCRYAVKEWGWLGENPFSDVKRPEENEARDRVATDEEIDRLILMAGSDVTTVRGRVIQAFRFAVETGMRAGEIRAMRKPNIHKDYVHVPAVLPGERKSKKRDVALSPGAKELLAPVAALGLDVWGLNEKQIDANFRDVRDMAGIEDLTFHDSRHTAITRLAKRLTVLELARMVGHRDINQLLTYYNESASEIAKKLL